MVSCILADILSPYLRPEKGNFIFVHLCNHKNKHCENHDGIFFLGESDITLEFSESSMGRNIFSQMSALSCLYTVQILPRTDKDSMEVFVFEEEVDRIFSGLSIFNIR